MPLTSIFFFFFFNDTATTEIYTLSLHDALPIYFGGGIEYRFGRLGVRAEGRDYVYKFDRYGFDKTQHEIDRKSTRLNSSHYLISYAVFCLKKKKQRRKRIFLLADRYKKVHTSCS